MNTQYLITETINFVKNHCENDHSGHDFLHISRVVHLASYLQKKEGGDAFLIEMAAWLHDIGDPKLHQGKDKNYELTYPFLTKLNLDQSMIKSIFDIIENVSFSKNQEKKAPNIESYIVQDADRLDAIGAIGIARTFAFGASFSNPMYEIHNDFIEKKINNETTINHFYHKLLKIKDLLNTESAIKLAEKRHLFLIEFLTNFEDELLIHQ